MAWAPLVLAAVGGVMAAKGQMDAGRAQQEAANFNAKQDEIEAAQTRDAYRDQAEKIRRMGRAQASEAKAAYSASGVSVGSGTPVLINDQIQNDTESDAYNTILTGNRRADSLEAQAAMSRRSGASMAKVGQRAATGSLLSTAGSTYSAWKKNQ